MIARSTDTGDTSNQDYGESTATAGFRELIYEIKKIKHLDYYREYRAADKDHELKLGRIAFYANTRPRAGTVTNSVEVRRRMMDPRGLGRRLRRD